MVIVCHSYIYPIDIATNRALKMHEYYSTACSSVGDPKSLLTYSSESELANLSSTILPTFSFFDEKTSSRIDPLPRTLLSS